MTLIEVLLAVGFLAAALMGIIGVLIEASRLSIATRHRDSAMAVLSSYADRFARIDPTLADNTPFFSISATPTGDGLSWATNWDTVTDEAYVPTSGFPIYLGNDLSTRVKAHVFKTVQFVNKTDGSLSITNPSSSDDFCLISATFKVEYTLRNVLKSHSITVLREIPTP